MVVSTAPEVVIRTAPSRASTAVAPGSSKSWPNWASITEASSVGVTAACSSSVGSVVVGSVAPTALRVMTGPSVSTTVTVRVLGTAWLPDSSTDV